MPTRGVRVLHELDEHPVRAEWVYETDQGTSGSGARRLIDELEAAGCGSPQRFRNIRDVVGHVMDAFTHSVEEEGDI